ncbi:MAG: hypothetical protein AAFO04_30235 [Cyanobacteria bacterium J06592_8]
MNENEQPQYTNHWATSEENCEEMRSKYNWNLTQASDSKDGTDLPVECQFEGDATFPNYYDEEED